MTRKIKIKPVRCVECKTVYWIPAEYTRLHSYEKCGNDDCNCKKYRGVKPGESRQ